MLKTLEHSNFCSKEQKCYLKNLSCKRYLENFKKTQITISKQVQIIIKFTNSSIDLIKNKKLNKEMGCQSSTSTQNAAQNKPLVIFILGGPGSGKGTQCDKIRKHFNFVHLSAGDLLREQRQNPLSNDGKLIQQYIVEGKIVPSQITIRLLEKAMQEEIQKAKAMHKAKQEASAMQSSSSVDVKFLIDGFPRNIYNLENWNQQMQHKINHPFIVNMKCSQKVMTERLLNRGKTSGRTDDNQNTIKKRFVTFNTETMPVVEHYRQKKMLVEVEADKDVDTIFNDLVEQFKEFEIYDQ